MTSKYFEIPFANSGDKTSIPNASQPSGDVSFEDGWTPDYAKDQATDPDAKDIPRQIENYFKFVMSEAMKEMQEIGAKPYDPLVNYPIGAVIPGSDNIKYNCQIANGPATSVKNPVGLSSGEWVKDIPLTSSIQGGVISNAVDVDHDITIQPCIAPDSLKAEIIQLKTAITKQINATWAIGDNVGGLFSGTVAADTTYHIFLIKKDSDGSIDAGFDTDLNAANIPSGWTNYRRIGSLLSDSIANISPFLATELAGGAVDYQYSQPKNDISAAPGNTTRNLLTISVPEDIECIAKINYLIDLNVVAYMWVRSTFTLNAAATGTNFTSAVSTQAGLMSVIDNIIADASGQIAYRASNSTLQLFLMTNGFIDRRI